jgi:N-acetylneuraminic acid mutarotase
MRTTPVSEEFRLRSQCKVSRRQRSLAVINTDSTEKGIRVNSRFTTQIATALIASLVLPGCGSSLTRGPQGEWTWVGGSNTENQIGVYGVKGTPSASNMPGGRQFAVGWLDKSGNFWLFGGMGPQNTGVVNFNDLWRYSAGEWTWMSGSAVGWQVGIYGTVGVAAPSNVPGARQQALGWTDSAGNLWLFGGYGVDSAGQGGFLNDLWMYSEGQWTWMGGSNIANQSGIYGTLGTPAPGNVPGGRSLSTTWTDASGDFWLFGGDGYDSAGNNEYLNDLWKYSGGQWTWVSGSDLVNQPGSYGTIGVPAPANVPGARLEATGWTDSAGNLWLFGGSNGPKGQFNLLNDLWEFSGGKWTWISGADSVNQSGVYGIEGVTDAANVPGARVSAVAWTDASGDIWLFGGNGYDSTGIYYFLNDLWKYSAGQWTWVNGADLVNQPGSYGTQGTAARSNVPGARYGGLSWIASSGKLCLFGGGGYDASVNTGFLDDLWCYQP